MFKPRINRKVPGPKIELPKFVNAIFPIIRRVVPNLIANDIVSVQPMSLPAGSVFYMDYKYGKSDAAWRKLRKAGIKRK